MAIYKTSELFNKLCEIINDGYEYIDVDELSSNNSEEPTELYFEAQSSEYGAIDYESVESCSLPENYAIDNSSYIMEQDDFCSRIAFTYHEIFVLMHAVDITLHYLEEISKNSTDKTFRSDVEQYSIDFHNLQTKFSQKFKLHF